MLCTARRGCAAAARSLLSLPAHSSCAARGSSTQPSAAQAGEAWRSTASAFPVGLFAGGVGSFVGIGGALLMVPITLRMYGLKQLQANATALAPNVATCVSGAFVFHAAGDVDWTAAALVASAAAITTRAGARMAHRLSDRAQKQLFGAAMCGMGPIIAAKPLLQRSNNGSGGEAPCDVPSEGRLFRVPSAPETAYMLALGGVTGLCSGVLGIGAGTMCTVGLAIGGPAHWGHKMVLGTAFAAQLLPHATGAYTHWQLGNLRLDLVPWLVAGTAVGSALASRVVVDVDQDALRLLFGAYAFTLGVTSLRAASRLAK